MLAPHPPRQWVMLFTLAARLSHSGPHVTWHPPPAALRSGPLWISGVSDTVDAINQCLAGWT